MAALTTELQALKVRALMARAAANGADEATLDLLAELDKEEQVKQAIKLIVEREIALPTVYDDPMTLSTTTIRSKGMADPTVPVYTVPEPAVPPKYRRGSL